MRIAVVTCSKYQDAWLPFFTLFRKFWKDCPYPVYLITDDDCSQSYVPDDHLIVTSRTESWCSNIVELCLQSPSEPILLLQEDFFLTSRPRTILIEEALTVLKRYNAGCVRLYPCPGADFYLSMEPHYGGITLDADYRISCQAAIWDPHYLGHIAAHIDASAHDFEIHGTQYSRTLKKTLMAFYREVTPWPLEYLCTAIVRGEWTVGAKKLCDEHGIVVDWSQRPFQKVC